MSRHNGDEYNGAVYLARLAETPPPLHDVDVKIPLWKYGKNQVSPTMCRQPLCSIRLVVCYDVVQCLHKDFFAFTWRPRWLGRWSACLSRSISWVQVSPSAYARRGFFLDEEIE